MNHWALHFCLTKASVTRTALARLYITLLLIVIGLCGAQELFGKASEGEDRSFCLLWGKGQQGMLCFGLGMILHVCLAANSHGKLLAEKSSCFPLPRHRVIPVISLCFSAAPASPFPELLPWGTASWAASGSAHPLSLCSIGQDVCPLLWWTAVYVEVWSDRAFCLSWGPHYFSSVEGRIRKQRLRLADDLLACLFMSMDITCASAGLIFGLFFPIWSLMCELMNFSMFRGGFLDVLTEVKVTRAVPNSTSPLIELKTLPFFFFSFEMSICTFRQYV